MPDDKIPQGYTVLSVGRSVEDEEVDLLELFVRLLTRWKLITALSVVCAIVAGIYSFLLQTPLYKATSVLYVLNMDSIIDVSNLQIGNAITYDYIKVFGLWEVQEQVISNLGLPYTYTELDEMISVSNSSNTRMLDISATSKDAFEAQRIANEYANVARDYISSNMKVDKPTIISMARVPEKPENIHVLRSILIGMFGGGILACAIVAIQYFADDKYKTAEDIRKYTGLSTLAIVPINDFASEAKEKKAELQRGNGRNT